MSKQGGMGDRLYIDGYDISGDIGSLSSIGGGCAVLDVTGILSSAIERVGGLRDGRMEFVSHYNPSADRQHDVLSTLPTTDRIATYMRGAAIGNAAACLNAKQINYDPTRAADGGITETVQAQGQGYGLEWGNQLTAGRRVDTGAANGTGRDFGAATAFGLQAYLHVFAFTGTDATIRLQESSDNAVGDAYANVTGGAFTAVTAAPFVQRIETARNLAVEQWLRVITSTSGGFSSLDFAVVVVKNETTVTFGG